MRAIPVSAGSRSPARSLLALALLAIAAGACRKSHHAQAAPVANATGEFALWRQFGGGHATRQHVTGDFDGDLDTDALEVNFGEPCRLLLNDGNGKLLESSDLEGTQAYGLPALSRLTRCAVAVDVDSDGDLDLVLGNNGVNTLLRNNGNAEFRDGTDLAQVAPYGLPAIVDDTWALAFADVDGDGDQDLIVGNTGQNQLLLNAGNGEYLVGTDLAGTLSTGLPAASDATRGLVVQDLDSDGDPDIVVANDGGGPVQLLLNNNGVGEYVDATTSGTQGFPLLATTSRGLVVGNFDGTNQDDIVVVGRGRARLLLNDGSLFFTDANTDWKRQKPGTTATWRGLHVVSASAMFLVGDGGNVRFSSGAGWNTQTSGATANLLAVHGTGASDIFSVGAGGTILHYNGTAWSSQTSGVTGTLNGVFAVSGTDVYAVGDAGLLLHSNDGSTWSSPIANPADTTSSPPNGVRLRAVWAANSTNLWAVGDGGMILFSANGSTWTAQTSGSTRDLYAITGTSATSLWAVGEGGVILRSTDGSTWNPQVSGVGVDLFALWAADASNLRIGGRAGTVLLTSNGGTAWTTDDPGTVADLHAIGGPSTSNVYAMGVIGTIVNDTGTSTTAGVPTTFLDARAVVAHDVDGDFDLDLVIACNGQNRCFINNGSALFTDGTGTVLPTRIDDSWGITLPPQSLDAGTVRDLLIANTGQNRLDLGGAGSFTDGTFGAATGLPAWIDAHGIGVGDVTGDGWHDLVVAVNGGQNRLFRRQGVSFVDGTASAPTGLPVATDPSQGITLADVNGDNRLDILVANNGAQSRLYLNNGTGLFSDGTSGMPARVDPTVDIAAGDVDGDGDVDLAIANQGAQNRLYLGDNAGNFVDQTASTLPTDTDPSTDVALADVDNDGDLDLVVANAGQWRTETSGTTNDLHAVHALAPNDIWAVGVNGTVAHWNGTAWTATTQIAAGGATLRGVLALSTTDVVAVGDGGVIIRYNGTIWASQTSPTSNTLRAVHGTSGSDLHAVGDAGTAIRDTGTGWATVATGTTQNLLGLFAHSAAAAIAVGAGGTTLGWNGSFWAPFPAAGATTLVGCSGIGGIDTFAVGATGLLLRHDGVQWETVASGTTNNLNGVTGSALNDVCAVGDGGRIVRDSGTGFVVETSPTAANLLAVDALTASHAVAVGSGGVILQWRGQQNRLLRNNGSGVFTDVTATALPTARTLSTDVALADADLDGDLDLAFATARGQNLLYINNGAGAFTDGTDLTAQLSTGLEADGDDSRAVTFISARGTQWDLVFANFEQQNRLHFNLGGAEYQDRTDEGGASNFGLPADRSATRAIGRGEWNKDGRLDLVFVNAGGLTVLIHR